LKKLIFLLLPCALTFSQEAVGTAKQTDSLKPPPTTPEDLKAGERLFQVFCAYCHGTDGGGGRGANLVKTKLRHAPDDEALFKAIRGGIPGTEMPPNDLSAHQAWQVTFYVRSLGHVSRPAVAGDAQRGKVLYDGKGNCTACHTISGHGGPVGPDLTEIGASKGIDYLRASLVDPGVAVPDGFLQVRVVTKDGSRVTGVRINEDNSSIQLRDLSGKLRSYWKDELREINKDYGKSPMPSYRQTFSPAELDDILAYLESLQGE
jgi:putative heme-binding domain-containing protein